MGMNVWCCRWWTITYDKLKELCEPEVAEVEGHIHGDEWQRLAGEDLTHDDTSFIQAVAALEKRFKAATGGLELVFLLYDEEMDQCGGAGKREHERILFGVEGVEDFTPAGGRFKDVLVDTQWTEAG